MNNLNDFKISISEQSITLVVVHDVYLDKHAEYENIIDQLILLAQKQSGFLSIDSIKPAHNDLRYIAIIRFKHKYHAEQWINLPERNNLLKPIEPWLIKGDVHQIQTDPDFWFKPDIVAPKLWKRFISSWIAVLPLALTIPSFYVWFFKDVLFWKTFWIGLPISLTISFFMTYVTMPYITKRFNRWLSG